MTAVCRRAQGKSRKEIRPHVFPETDELIREIETTVAHEVAQHFGFGEETLAQYGYD